MNPAVWVVLFYRRCGIKHSRIDWKLMRQLYDYCEEEEVARDAPASGPLDSFHVFPEGTVFSDEEEDPTPWCHVCMARSHMECTCLPIAENN